jgi:hypothetical protein
MRVIEAITRIDAIQKPLRMPQERFSPGGRYSGIPLFRPRTASATRFQLHVIAQISRSRLASLGYDGDHRALHPISIAVKGGGGAGRPAPLVLRDKLRDKQPIHVLDQLLPMSLD